MKAYERLLKYVVVRTPSDENSETVPSSVCQFDLARLLEAEMKDLGLTDVVLDDQCYLYGKLPATAGLEELPIICCIFNNEYLGMVRQWQKLFYGKRYAMTNLKAGALSRRTDGQEYPEYTPDFIRLAESYGAKGIRVTEKDQIAAAFEEAKKNTKTPTIIEFIIDPEEMVYPMVKPGGTLADLIMDC